MRCNYPHAEATSQIARFKSEEDRSVCDVSSELPCVGRAVVLDRASCAFDDSAMIERSGSGTPTADAARGPFTNPGQTQDTWCGSRKYRTPRRRVELS